MKKVILSTVATLSVLATTASADSRKVYKQVDTESLFSSEKRVYLVEDGKEHFMSSTTKEFAPIESLFNLCKANAETMTGCGVEISAVKSTKNGASFSNTGEMTVATGFGPLDVNLNEKVATLKFS